MFKRMNFARFLILTMLLSSIPLGWFAWEQHTRILGLRTALEQQGSAENLAGSIQALSRQHSSLVRAVDAEGMRGQSNPRSYINSMAFKDKIDIGQVKIDPSENEVMKGVIDKSFRVRPVNKDASFGRTKLGNFFYSLESESRRVKVTEIKIEAEDRKLKPHEKPNDKWTFECKVTSRQKKGV